MTHPKKTLVLLTWLALLADQAVDAQVSSTFASDLESWLVTGDNGFAHQATGGSSAGYLGVNDLAVGQQNWVVAPPEYLGDWSSAAAADTLSVDYLFERLDPGDELAVPALIISGPGGTAVTTSILLPENVWTNVKVALDPANWNVIVGSWSAILANVTSLRIGGGFVDGPEELGVDNVQLSLTPGATLNECVLDDFNDGTTGDWSFVDAGSSNPGIGGNGGGYVEIGDDTAAGQISQALAPSKFRGDWSALEGNGRVVVDVRLLATASVPVGSPEFLRISGPGGSAHWALIADEVPSQPLEWKRFEIPLQASEWVIDSGSWIALLDDVTEVAMEIEVADLDETIGFDNFGLLASDCAIGDGDVMLQVSDLAVTQQISFPEIESVAFNPADGELYGLVGDDGSNNGFYPVTGAQRLTQLESYDRPAHLIFDDDGDAFISENFDGEVFRYEFSGPSSTVWASGFHSGDDDPYGFTFAPPGFNTATVVPGDLLVTDHGSGGPNEIWNFSPDVAEGEALPRGHGKPRRLRPGRRRGVGGLGNGSG